MTATPDSQQFEKLNDHVRQSISPRRYLHVLGVVHTASVLAERHSMDIHQAAVAGLLHDISKELPSAQIAVELTALGHSINQEDLPYPRTWHGLHAAAIAPEKFGIHDREILQAVAQHTTGDEEMSLFSRLLFIADFCEPGRKIAVAQEVLSLARSDLAAGFCRVLDLKIHHMLHKPAFAIHPRTLRCVQRWLPALSDKISTTDSVLTAGQ